MKREDFDVVVIGAGVAGVCCAAELVLQGLRPLLIAESKEVGVAVRAKFVGENFGVMQAVSWSSGWGGGGWPHLVRKLNVPVSIPDGFHPMNTHAVFNGDRKVHRLEQSALSGSSFAAVLTGLFPQMSSVAGEIDMLYQKALEMPIQDLMKMHDVPFADWIEDQKVDELTAHVFSIVGAFCAATCLTPGPSADWIRANMSTYGLLGALRTVFSDALFCQIAPDNRRGLLIPLVRAVERHGGTVWRGSRVARVETDGGRVGTVVLEDGREAKAPLIAIATGNARFAGILDALPPELEAPLAFAEQFKPRDFSFFAVLDRPVLPREFDRWITRFGAEGNLESWIAPYNALTPWAVEQGKQFVGQFAVIPEPDLPKHGSEQDIYDKMNDALEFYAPGYKDAIVDFGTDSHPASHLWFDHVWAGPKVPRSVESVSGLFFVGSSSWPTGGLWFDGAATNGILGAREMATVLPGMRTRR
ncbi:MAG TPA: hypothetical protein VGG09_13805 [Acidimicrobiales bacterium]|jgi:hypothetical protein